MKSIVNEFNFFDLLLHRIFSGEDDIDERYEIYKAVLALKPRSAAAERAPLYFLKGDLHTVVMIKFITSTFS